MVASFPDPVDWPEISRLLDEALALAAPQREAWLAALPAESAAHHETLRRLLAPHAGLERDDFLATLPPLGPPGGAENSLAAGTVVGPYRLLRELGRGGMGEVWLAERADGLVRRPVALKLPHVVWGDAFAGRLARERHILAALEHPHIARLYDTGLDARGRPYLAMEYVDGVPIDAWCRAQDVPLRGRLELLLQVLAAVAHAHSRLVVHRDLKPANILVTRDGQARLLDFGIAKLVQGDAAEGTALTELAGSALTLRYASPEQIRGEPLGVGSDVYSLGVVAYELLAQQPLHPPERGHAAALARAIAEVEPRRPSDIAPTPALRKSLRGDLDAILGRALEKDAARRYPGADAFAQDLERHLRGEPVRAHPASRGYRAAKFVRRHRLGVAMGAFVAVAVVAGSGVALWQAHVARQQEARATIEIGRLEAVRGFYGSFTSRLATQAADDPAAITRPHAVANTIEATLAELDKGLDNSPVERGAQLQVAAEQLNYLGEYERARIVGEDYLAHLKTHGAPADQVIRAYESQGRTLFQLGRLADCEAMRRAGLAWGSPEADDDSTASVRLWIATDLASVLWRQGKRAEAGQVLQDAARRAHARFPNSTEEAHVLLQQAQFHENFDDPRALAEIRRAMAIEDRHPEDHSESRVQIQTYLGTTLVDNGQATEALAPLRSALDAILRDSGRASNGALFGVLRLSSALAHAGQVGAALSLLDEQRAAMANLKALSRTNDLLLRRFAAEASVLDGDAAAALARLPAGWDELAMADRQHDAPGLVLAEIQARMLVGEAPRALAIATALDAAWPQPSLMSLQRLRARSALAQARLGAGDAAGALAAATSLMADLEAQQSSANATWRATAEVAALAAAHLDDRTAAAAWLARADGAGVAFPSAAERADSALRRAQVLAALGRATEARAAARSALQDLQGQSPASPRPALARRLAEA